MARALPASTTARSLFPAPQLSLIDHSGDEPASVLEGADVWNAVPTLAPAAREISGSEAMDIGRANYIVEQAELHAESIVLQAEMRAEGIVENATANAVNIRETAKQNGYNDGLAKARTDVEAEFNAKFVQRCAELKESVDSVVSAFADEREIMWKSMETEIIGFSLDIAKKITKVEIDRNDKIVVGVVTDAMRRVSDRTSLRVLVNPNELANVRSNREELMMALDGIKNLEIDPDRRIGRGGCVIETNAGSVDAKIETQFEQVEAALQP